MKKLKAIDLFSGCGGLSLGFIKAGVDVLAAFDNWEPAVKVYEENFSHPIHKFDLSDSTDLDIFTRYNPDMIIGACIELIGDANVNPVAPREAQFIRAEGFGSSCDKAGLQNITDGNYPLYSAADFRRMCGGKMIRNQGRGHTEYSAFHFHNFFANFNQTR